MNTYRDGLNERAISTLADLGHLVTGGLPQAEVAQELAERFCGLFDADYCRYWWRTQDDNEVRVIAHHPPIEFKEDWEHKKSLTGSSSLVKGLFVEGNLRIEPDARSASDAESRYVTVYGARSGVHVPVVVDGKVMGDFAMVSTREKEHFSPEDSALFEALANFAALALSR